MKVVPINLSRAITTPKLPQSLLKRPLFSPSHLTLEIFPLLLLLAFLGAWKKLFPFHPQTAILVSILHPFSFSQGDYLTVSGSIVTTLIVLTDGTLELCHHQAENYSSKCRRLRSQPIVPLKAECACVSLRLKIFAAWRLEHDLVQSQTIWSRTCLNFSFNNLVQGPISIWKDLVVKNTKQKKKPPTSLAFGDKQSLLET